MLTFRKRGLTPKDIRTSNHACWQKKQAFDDAVNEKIEAMRIQKSAEMDAKLCCFKDDLISHFEERIRNLAPLQREMTTPQKSLLHGSFEIHIVRKKRTKTAHKLSYRHEMVTVLIGNVLT
ncbi:hypothetical protein ACH5RR_029467 [Cinchona calisaya]|uniref:Uncharacterized protein n=1 Tax=Cinchona calisaya TaxID=153742 RepID=A0ABD2YRR2_9GENT